MTDLNKYKEVDYKLPDKILTWHLYGAGMENFGRDKKPDELPMPAYGPDQLLVRVDAISICMSDIKVINQGNTHARLTGRDLASNPVTLGHEAAVTIVGVGEQMKDKYKVGERYIVQADVFVKGVSMAFGYVLPGGQTQYQVVGQEILNGDEGCYLIPMQEDTGYAEAALAEPWACVVASYGISRRAANKPGGKLWVICASGDTCDYDFDLKKTPEVIVATGLCPPMLAKVKAFAADKGSQLVESFDFASLDMESFAGQYGPFDDIVMLGADAEKLEKAAALLGPHGIMSILAQKPLAGPVKIDIGKVHYKNHSYLGTAGKAVSEAYAPIRTPSELKPGGTAWFIGAGGPMGQMHTQRAVEMENGPKKVIATDVDTARLNSVKERFAPIAERNGVDFRVVNPKEMSKEEFDALLNEFTGGRGFDDIVVLAMIPALIEHAAPFLAEQGLMNVFAGLPIGTIVSLDMSPVYMKQIRFVGSSGSKLSDMVDTLHAAESGQLSTNTSVAAIGGMEASWNGMLAAKEGRFPGKVVIYPQVRSLELTAVQDLKDVLPNVYAKLTDGMFWNREAEAELLRTCAKI
jgi:L-sorbose 1-phosphate reductase